MIDFDPKELEQAKSYTPQWTQYCHCGALLLIGTEHYFCSKCRLVDEDCECDP